MKILVTDVNTRKGFDTVSGLERHFPKKELVLASPKDTRFSLNAVYGRRVQLLDKTSQKGFNEGLLRISATAGEDLICLPVEEDTCLQLYQFWKDHSEAKIKALLPAEKSFLLSRDKEAVGKFALSIGLSAPRFFEAGDIAGLRADFMPVIIKPKTGTGSQGLVFIETKEDLPLLDGLDFSTHLVQEKIEQSEQVHGAFFLFKDGKLMDYYGHKRLRTYPVKGGVTVYSKTEYNETICRQGTALLEALNWNGVAMVEYLYSAKDDSYKLIEVNPRLWGSILLSEKAQTGLLANYVRLCAGGVAQPHTPLPEETFIRWFFPFDLLRWVKGKEKIKDFWKLKRSNTAYIGFTYAPLRRGIAFLLYQLVNVGSLKKFLKKTRG